MPASPSVCATEGFALDGRIHDRDAARLPRPPAFRAERLDVDGIVVIAVEGEVDMVTAPALARVLADAGTQPLVVDLCECEFVDSTGLHLMVDHRDRVPGLAIACAPQSAPERLFTLTMHDRLPVYASREDALAAVRAR